MRALIATLALLLIAPQIAVAQLRGVKAELTPVVESDAAPGSAVRVALQVRLPEQFHVQSDAPRDPALIPTVLTVDAPEGITVAEIVFPPPQEFNQLGQSQPLLVFPHEFAIGVRFDIAPSVPIGQLDVPARLRYQACDDRL
ncbi:MAG TPA: protein-disulfide reductase DsbD domain-containing protein, partial [Vicinamibacterales bacterium]|nr:protein-disulfide reductase DsbD domain-containing protein [Vicinamibacterales bacterium]